MRRCERGRDTTSRPFGFAPPCLLFHGSTFCWCCVFVCFSFINRRHACVCPVFSHAHPFFPSFCRQSFLPCRFSFFHLCHHFLLRSVLPLLDNFLAIFFVLTTKIKNVFLTFSAFNATARAPRAGRLRFRPLPPALQQTHTCHPPPRPTTPTPRPAPRAPPWPRSPTRSHPTPRWRNWRRCRTACECV